MEGGKDIEWFSNCRNGGQIWFPGKEFKIGLFGIKLRTTSSEVRLECGNRDEIRLCKSFKEVQEDGTLSDLVVGKSQYMLPLRLQISRNYGIDLEFLRIQFVIPKVYSTITMKRFYAIWLFRRPHSKQFSWPRAIN